MVRNSTSLTVGRASPLVRITRFIDYKRRSGNLLAIFDVEVTLPNGEKRTYVDLKLCKNGNRKPFLSEPQDRVGDGTWEKRYLIEDLSLRRYIETVLIKYYEEERRRQLGGQLALALGVGA
jgi:hypothetical protein